MILSSNLYSSITLATGATPQVAIAGTQFNPIRTDLSTFYSITGLLTFNFTLITSSTRPGPNATLQLVYQFSDISYSGAAITSTLNQGGIIQVPLQNIASNTLDITSQTLAKITGRYLYTWINLINFQAPITFSAFVNTANNS